MTTVAIENISNVTTVEQQTIIRSDNVSHNLHLIKFKSSYHYCLRLRIPGIKEDKPEPPFSEVIEPT